MRDQDYRELSRRPAAELDELDRLRLHTEALRRGDMRDDHPAWTRYLKWHTSYEDPPHDPRPEWQKHVGPDVLRSHGVEAITLRSTPEDTRERPALGMGHVLETALTPDQRCSIVVVIAEHEDRVVRSGAYYLWDGSCAFVAHGRGDWFRAELAATLEELREKIPQEHRRVLGLKLEGD